MKSFMRVLCVSALFAGIAFTTGCGESEEEKAAKEIKKAGEQLQKDLNKAAKEVEKSAK